MATLRRERRHELRMWNLFQRLSKPPEAAGSSRSDTDIQGLDYDVAMRRLVYLAGAGSVLIVAYAMSAGRADSLRVAAVGLMAGGAALVTGGLMGFVFGIPYARESAQDVSETQSQKRPTPPPDERERARYRPNSNLEQVSDWLTKIIVGVGLIQFNQILAKLWEVAGYVATGLGDSNAPAVTSAQAFASTILIYFAVCGFVFAFLWARLYYFAGLLTRRMCEHSSARSTGLRNSNKPMRKHWLWQLGS